MAGSISFTQTESGYADAVRTAYLRGALGWRSLPPTLLVLVLIWLVVAILSLFGGRSVTEAAWEGAMPLAVAAAIIPLMYLLGYTVSGRRARRQFRQQPSFSAPIQASWSDDGIKLRTPTSEGRLPWTNLHRWRQERVGILLYVTEAIFHILPRSAFDAAQWDDLGKTLRANAPDRGRARNARLEPPRPWRPLPAAGPGRVALLWIVCTAFYLIDNCFFPGKPAHDPSAMLSISGAAVLAGLLAGRVLGLRGAALDLAALFLIVTAAWIVLLFPVEWAFAPREIPGSGWLGAIPLAFVTVLVWQRYRARSRMRRAAAILMFVAANTLALAAVEIDRPLWRASAEVRDRFHLAPPEDDKDPLAAIRAIPVDTVWEAQPRLLTAALDRLRPRSGRGANVYALTIAAGGTQQLFAREARLALRVAAAHYGGAYRSGVLLSNGQADYARAPFATRANLAAAAAGLRARVDPARDVAFIYLVSHGSRDAELETDLPSYDDLTPISASSVADALARAGVRRRIVIVSACYAGSWIPALASDDTIIITAARKDRTSFGCDDTRELTYFGEAFLKGPLARGASLRMSFEAARATVARWERREGGLQSEPQASVGRNMRELWEH